MFTQAVNLVRWAKACDLRLSERAILMDNRVAYGEYKYLTTRLRRPAADDARVERRRSVHRSDSRLEQAGCRYARTPGHSQVLGSDRSSGGREASTQGREEPILRDNRMRTRRKRWARIVERSRGKGV